ncbi:MAG TPA: type I polyketide synthase, partial [Pyrinomonadaceae bacterium]
MASFKEVVFQMVARGELSAEQALSLVRNVRVASAEGARGDAAPAARPRVAVVGMAGCFPGAPDVGRFWRNLRAGRATTRETPAERWSAERFYDPDASKPGKTNCKWGGFLEGFDLFDPLFFQISPKEAELMDPQQRLFLTQAWRALEDAGYAGEDARGRPWGVFVGAGGGDYVHKLSAEGVALDGYAFMGNSPSILAARIAYLLDLKGPCLTVDTACSSSLAAIHLACESIALGTSEMAIAGGVCVLTTPNFYLAGSKTGMLSPRGQCRAFDDAADGFVPGEAAAAVVLKSLERAVRDGDHIYGVIEGSSINQDGRTNGITAPSAPSQTALELKVYEQSGVNPEGIGYVEAHGTGTRLGDPIEVEALTAAFRRYTARRQFCALGSVKTNVGHTMTAAGVVGVIKVLLALKHGELPPSLNFERPNTAIRFEDSPFFVNRELRAWQTAEPRRAAVSSFGFSGTNVHMVLAEAPPRTAPPTPPRHFHLVTLSAKTESALRRSRAQLAAWARLQPDDADLAHACFTLGVGRSHFERRLALVVKDGADLVEQLERQGAHGEAPRTANAGPSLNGPEAGRLFERLAGAAYDSEEEYRNDLLLLADLYTSGREVDWARLYSEPERRRVPLPTYPFDEQPYGVAARRGPRLLPALHPLLDRLQPAAGGLVFDVTLENSMPALRDHVVRGSSILPGVALLEMARAAGDALADRAGVERLEDVCFLRPLTVGGEPRRVTLTLREEGGAGGRRMSFEVAREDEAKHVYCRGAFVLRSADAGEGEPAAARVDIKEIEGRCDEGRIEASALYDTFAEAGVECGPFCRGVRRVLLGRGEALSELSLPDEELRGLEHYRLHPTLMDGAFQTAMALHAREAGALMVPFSVGEVEVYGALTRRCYAYVRKLPGDAGADEASFHVALVDEAGRVLVRLKNFRARAFPTRGPAPRKHETSPAVSVQPASESEAEPVSYYQPAWVEKSVEEKTGQTEAGSGVVLIFHHAHDFGLTEALAESYGGRVVLQVLLGEEYRTLAPGRFEIDHRRRQDYERL